MDITEIKQSTLGYNINVEYQPSQNDISCWDGRKVQHIIAVGKCVIIGIPAGIIFGLFCWGITIQTTSRSIDDFIDFLPMILPLSGIGGALCSLGGVKECTLEHKKADRPDGAAIL